jgi:hypothetical protein
MRKLYIIILILILAYPIAHPGRVQAAIAGVGANSSGSAGNETSGTSLTVSITVQLEAGNVGLMVVACDNTATTNGDHDEISSVSDTQGSTWTNLGEETAAGSGAAGGVTVGLWMVRPTSNLTTSDTVTITFANTITAKAARIYEFTVGNPLTSAGSNVSATSGNGWGSLSISGLAASAEYLYFRALAKESSSTTSITPTTNFTEIGNSRSGASGASSVLVRGEFRIVTATSETSNPTLTVSADSASVFVALAEQAGGGAPAGRRTVIISEDRDRRRLEA